MTFVTAQDTFATTESFFTCDDCYKELLTLKERQEKAKKKLVLAIIPFGIPGSGKSTFLKGLKSIVERLKWTIVSVSSDEVRGEHVKKYIETHPGVSNKEAFDKTGKTATQNFNKRVEQLIRESEKSPSGVHIIFIDKNNPPNGLDKTVGMIK